MNEGLNFDQAYLKNKKVNTGKRNTQN